MASVVDFPSLQADGRTYPVTGFPSSQVELITGVQINYQHGNQSANRLIEIKFLYRRLAEAEQVSAHYLLAKEHSIFKIPMTLLQSHPNSWTLTPAQHRYKYASPPAREPAGGGLFNITVRFLTVF
jgi:hypothetical protein